MNFFFAKKTLQIPKLFACVLALDEIIILAVTEETDRKSAIAFTSETREAARVEKETAEARIVYLHTSSIVIDTFLLYGYGKIKENVYHCT